MVETEKLQALNYIGGEWRWGKGEVRPILDPGRGEVIAEVASATPEEVDQAVRSAEEAFRAWREVPVVERVQYLFRYKALLEAHFEELARTITLENGKTLAEAKGELRRGVENVEVACGMPSLIQGYNNLDIARGIDEHLFREPLGVVAAITPFNFPGMIPLWFLPYAIAAGNAFILKPSDRVPLTAVRLIELLLETGLPKGVVQLVHGGKETVDALLDHPGVRAISFVGSTPVARYIYARAAQAGKRVQAQGGAKNPAVVLPDADMEMAAQILADSAFGSAGQRCLAVSTVITVGPAREAFARRIRELALARRVGYGLEEGVEMGPVISAESRARILGLVEEGVKEGARLFLDGREGRVPGYEGGFYLFPTILEDVPPQGRIAQTEVFGPVLSLMHAETLEEAIDLVNARAYGNQASIFTESGAAARLFRQRVKAGNIGVNIGVAAPMAFYPFSGMKESFFGDLHAQGRHAMEFYTETKVVVERWGQGWSRRF